MSPSQNKNILFIFTGSIACYKACNILSKLKQQGHSIKVVMSKSSLEFVGSATVEGLVGVPPIIDMYGPGHVMDHINLMRWADLILVAPATAHYINKIANGIGDDLLTTLFLAHDFNKPFLIAPAMNTKMYLHPVTQKSIATLKELKIEILETASGVLACGEIGSGRLLEPELIFQEVQKHLGQQSIAPVLNYSTEIKISRPIKVLITAGGTSEAIDDVRVITNKSTGRTAAALADALIESGIKVTFLHSLNSSKPYFSEDNISFNSFTDLQNSLRQKLNENDYDWVVHAAAVSDYSVQKSSGKISSDQDEISLVLKKNPKLINDIKQLSPKTRLIGFKLTSRANNETIETKVRQLFIKANCDFVVQNDWSDIEAGQHKFRFYEKSQNLNDFQEIDSPAVLNATIFNAIVSAKELL